MSSASSKFATATAIATIALLAAAAAPLSASAQQLRPLPQQPQQPQQMPQPQRPQQLAQQPQRAQQPLPMQQPQQPPQQAQRAAPAKPYAAIAVTLPKPYADAGFEAFRQQLGAIAARKDRGALARLVANDFFWMGEQGDKANKKKSGFDNLVAAIDLDAKDGSGWETLTEAANETTLEAIPDRKGVMCAPANPTFDENAAEQLAKATGTEASDWGYPEKAGVEVRAAAQANAAVIDRLGMNLVRVLPEQPTTTGAAQQQAPSFVRVVTPSGKTGFVAADTIAPLGNDQLCYRNDAGTWKIVGYAGEE